MKPQSTKRAGTFPIPAIGPFPFPDHLTQTQVLYPGRIGEIRRKRDIEIEALFDAGMSIEAIGLEMGIAPGTVWTAIKYLELER